MIKYFLLGLYVKIITSFDDTITRIPIISSVTSNRHGQFMFSIGNILAVISAILIAIFFSKLLHSIPYYRYISIGLIFALAIAIHFDLFVHKQRNKAEEKIKKSNSIKRSTQLIGIGFIASFATLIDDIVAYTPLFLIGGIDTIYSIIGILIATIIEIIIVIYFSDRISHIKYKEEIASLGLVILGILMLFNIL